MRGTRVYVDTSVFGGTQDDRFAEASKWFFELIKKGKYRLLLSNIVYDELEDAPEKVRGVLAEMPEDAVEVIPIDDDVQELANAYVSARALDQDSQSDALHIAAATLAGADLLLSWNFRHIVNYERIRKFNSVNIAHGYRRIEIRSPLEVRHAEEEGI